MVSYYIALRLRQFFRIYSFSDIHPLIGVPVTLLLFAGVSALLYDKAPYPQWLYMACTLGVLAEAQPKKSNEYLRRMLAPRTFFLARLAENMLLLLPFLLVMAFFSSYLQMAICVALVFPYSHFDIRVPKPQVKALSTPYSKHAFEYNMIFRSMLSVYTLYIVLLFITGFSGNFYVFLVPFFIMLFFLQMAYATLEEPYYIWVYRVSASRFLWSKMRTLLFSYTITFLPFLLLSFVFYSSHISLVGLCLAVGLIALTGAMLIKYHFYPSAVVVQITQLIFFTGTVMCLASLQMLPVVIAFLVFSFFNARKKLKYILKC